MVVLVDNSTHIVIPDTLFVLDVALSGYVQWNGTMSLAENISSTESDSNRLCYEWTMQFLTPRDVLLSLKISTLPENMSLQVIKYSDRTTGELQGQIDGHTADVVVKIALANCPRVGIKVVANTFCPKGSDVKISYFSLLNESKATDLGKNLVVFVIRQ